MKIIFHLGIHKTASTLLQKNVFPYTSNCLFLDRAKSRELKRYILYADDFEFDKQKAYEQFVKIKDKYIKPKHDTIIISDEEFYGNPFIGALDRKRNIDRIINTFNNDLHFLIFLRNQNDLIESLYNQYVKTGGTANFKKFVSYQKYPLIFQNNYFIYSNYLKYIINNVSEENVTVQLFEDFRSDKLNSIQQLCKKLNLSLNTNINIEKSVNSSLNHNLIGLMRYCNKFTKSPKEPFLFLPNLLHIFFRKLFLKFSVFLKTNKKLIHIDDSFTDDIKRSNNELVKILPGSDLKKHHYPL